MKLGKVIIFIDSNVEFPGCLNGAPLLLPGPNVAVRGDIDRWLGDSRLHPQIVAEVDDSSLIKVMAQAGEGYFPAPTILAEEICKRYGVVEVGKVEEVRESFWLISTERRIQNQVVRKVLEESKQALFLLPDAGA